MGWEDGNKEMKRIPYISKTECVQKEKDGFNGLDSVLYSYLRHCVVVPARQSMKPDGKVYVKQNLPCFYMKR